jgi:hypothetical protein
MSSRMLSAAKNAREDGRDCALEWPGQNAVPPETLLEWRDRCRTNVIRAFESGAASSLCPDGTARDEFPQLLNEWERGFDEAASLAYGSPDVRAAAVKKLSGHAGALSALLAVIDIVPDEDRSTTLLTCARIADDVASDLSTLVGGTL